MVNKVLPLPVIKKINRKRNAGGVYPPAMAVCRALMHGLHQCRRVSTVSRDQATSRHERLLLHFVWLWLTGELGLVRHPEQMPTLTVVTGSESCRPHALRRVRLNNISWVEYALPYPTEQGVEWLWQPVPNGLNHYFVMALSHSTEHWRLSESDKVAFCQLLTGRWRVPARLRGGYRLRRQALFGYFRTMAALDDKLSSLAKWVLLGEAGRHHRAACTYQRQSSDAIRAQIFQAHTRYLERLRLTLTNHPLAIRLQVPVPGQDEWQPLLQLTTPLPQHLTTPGRTQAYHLDQSAGSKTYIALPMINIGSPRSLAIEQVRTFFSHLHEVGHSRSHHLYRLSPLCALINFRAAELALLFIALTGTRPTHTISVTREHCYERRTAIVYDKGRWRAIYLCEHLRQALIRLEGLYERLTHMTGTPQNSPLLWYQVQRCGRDQVNIVPLCARTLRTFMAEHWQNGVGTTPAPVPYQLRHLFAQHALDSTDPQLTTQEIDRLMGHADLGEELGSANHFPISQTRLTRHLERMVDFLQLPIIKER